MNTKKTAVLIPAYEPDEKLLGLLARFDGSDRFVPVVVNDGSVRPGAIEVFRQIPKGITVLVHEVNRGKGAALKTGIAHVLDHMPECDYVLTADADGQHRYEDIIRVDEELRAHPEALVIGGRTFEGDVPLRSRFGNSLTRQVFAAASGVKVYDTQTGLRAFGRDAMKQFLTVSGERYEYEINVLLEAARGGREIREIKIATVYLNENQSSHFNVVRDSIKIYGCIFKFCFSSLLSFLVDFVLLLLLKVLTKGLGTELSLAVSVVGARLVSASVNFTVNRKVVFKGNESLGCAILKYAALAVCVLCVNYAVIRLFTVVWGWPLVPSKILTEVTLFVINFFLQGRIVYRKKAK